MPEEPWTEICNIVQEAANETIANKKESKNAKWLSEEALQIAKEEEKWKAIEKGKYISN